MQKRFSPLIFFLIFLFLSPQMLAHPWKHEYKLTNAKPVHIDKLNDQPVVAIEYIPRTHDVYVLTKDRDLYTFNFKTGNLDKEHLLDFLDEPVDMKCRENACMILNASGGQKELYHVDFTDYLDGLKIIKWAILDDASISQIVSCETSHYGGYSTQELILKNASDQLSYLTYRLNTPDSYFTQMTTILKQGIYVDGVKKISLDRHQIPEHENRLQNLFKAYKINSMELDKDFLEDLLTIINNKTVTYANIYASNEEDYRKDAIHPDRVYVIYHHQPIKDVVLNLENQVTDRVIFLSGDDHLLYSAEVKETFTKKSMDTAEAMLNVIFYYGSAIFD